MIEVIDLCKSFGDLSVLKGINLKIEQGEKVVIIGPSGSGKSTLLRCLNCMEDPTSGKVLYHGVDLTDMKVNINRQREKIGMVFQHFNLFNNKTVIENIMLSPVLCEKRRMRKLRRQRALGKADTKEPVKTTKQIKEEAHKNALELLDRIGLADKADVYPSQLSGGYNPTYADTVADEVYNDRMGNISDAESTFRGLAQQDYQSKQEKNANVLNLYNTLEGTDYSRNRDTVGDYKNYLNLLASRYSTDRQADTNLDSANNDVYSAKLNGAVNNLSSARAADSQRYLYDTVSANQLAQNAQAERENAQKIEYDKINLLMTLMLRLRQSWQKNRKLHRRKRITADTERHMISS